MISWAILLVVLISVFLLSPERATGFTTYLRGASKWLGERQIYGTVPNKGFVYSPLVAVFFSSFTLVPVWLANILWRWLSAGVLLLGLWSMVRWGPFRQIPAHLRAWVFLLVLPVAAGNLDTGQANPIVAGLIMVAVTAAYLNRWSIAAIAAAGAFHWKIYPLVLGLLLVLIAPKKFSWRFGLALAAMAVVPFLFQKDPYVVQQYHRWYITRMLDNRFAYPDEIAPLDFWFLVVRLGKIPLSVTAYNFIRVASGAAIAWFCVHGRRKAWPIDRLYGGMFSFASAWMLLFGPASEALAYMLLVPAVAFGVVESFTARASNAARAAALASYGLLLFAVLRVGFFPQYKSLLLLAAQPVGALIFVVYCSLRYLDNNLWNNQGRLYPAR